MTFSMQAYFFLMQIHIEQDMKNEVVTCKTQFMSPFFILYFREKETALRNRIYDAHNLLQERKLPFLFLSLFNYYTRRLHLY